MNVELQKLVEQAKAANACAAGLDEVAKFETLEQVFASEHGSLLAALFAMKAMKARWPEAEATIQKDRFAWAAYRTAFGIN